MQFSLNLEQAKSLSNFFSNMAVAWFVAAFVAPSRLLDLARFSGYGIMCLQVALWLLKGIRK